jgi:hypothetical protein
MRHARELMHIAPFLRVRSYDRTPPNVGLSDHRTPVRLGVFFASEVVFIYQDRDPHLVQPLLKLAQGRIGESRLHMHWQLGPMLLDDLFEHLPLSK